MLDLCVKILCLYVHLSCTNILMCIKQYLFREVACCIL